MICKVNKPPKTHIVVNSNGKGPNSFLPSANRVRHWREWAVQLSLISLLALAGCGGSGGVANAVANVTPPNIVLIVMDGPGIDQWRLFGYGGTTPAATPNIDVIAQ